MRACVRVWLCNCSMLLWQFYVNSSLIHNKIAHQCGIRAFEQLPLWPFTALAEHQSEWKNVNVLFPSKKIFAARNLCIVRFWFIFSPLSFTAGTGAFSIFYFFATLAIYIRHSKRFKSICSAFKTVQFCQNIIIAINHPVSMLVNVCRFAVYATVPHSSWYLSIEWAHDNVRAYLNNAYLENVKTPEA